MTKTNEELAAELAAGLRAVADMIEHHPELVERFGYAFHNMNAFSDDKAELATFLRVARQHGASVEKAATDDDWFVARASWGAVSLDLNAHREAVCERVKVGEETITEFVPDPSVEVPMVEQTRTVEQFEWQCSPLLADEKAGA